MTRLKILWLSAGLMGVNADAHRAATHCSPSPVPCQAPCSSISLQPHPQLVSVCSQSLLPPQVFHLSSSTSMVMPVITSQAQNQSLLYHSYSLNCSCSTQRPWLSPYCFYTRLLPHQQESSIYTKKNNKSSSVLFPGV